MHKVASRQHKLLHDYMKQKFRSRFTLLNLTYHAEVVEFGAREEEEAYQNFLWREESFSKTLINKPKELVRYIDTCWDLVNTYIQATL